MDRVLIRGRRVLLPLVILAGLAGPRALHAQSDPVPPDSLPGMVMGLVFDSTRMAPLAGAVLEVPGLGPVAQADEEGRYLILNVPPGMYALAMRHPRLDTLGLTPIMRVVTVGPREQVALDFGLPSAERVQSDLCRGAAALVEDTPGVLSGVVLDEFSHQGLPGASVIAEWRSEGRDNQRVTYSRGSGAYALCGLPVDREVRVNATFLGEEGDRLTLDLGGAGVLFSDFTLRITRGGLLLGTVVDHETGRGVEAVEITIPATGQHTVSGKGGRFSFRDVPPGQAVLEAQHLAYGTTRYNVPVVGNGSVRAELRVSPQAIELEGITVEVLSSQLSAVGFYDRQIQGMGYHYDADAIAEGAMIDILPLLQRTPGVQVRPTGGAGYTFLGRGALGRCRLSIFVDGMRMGGFDLTLLNPDIITGLEVYPRRLQVPVEYERTLGTGGQMTGCGAILVWTR